MDGERNGRRAGDSNARSRDARRDAYVADISARLRHVCQHLTNAELASLVLDMAETRLRLADIDGQAFRRGLHTTTDAADAP
jgi:hypothetical protein